MRLQPDANGVSLTAVPGDAKDALSILGDKDQDHAMLDVYLHKVSIGSDPIEVDHSESSATFEINGTALFDTSQRTSTLQGKLAEIRMVNAKQTAYNRNDIGTGSATATRVTS